MPIFTIPSTIYIAPVPPVPFTNDEIECKIEPPTSSPTEGLSAHIGTYRAIVKYTVNYQIPGGQNGLTNVNIAITTPRDTFSNPFSGPAAALPASTVNTTITAGNATMSWTVGAMQASANAYLFAVDFAPPFPNGTQLTASFDISANQIPVPGVSVQITFPKTV
jgi:hypothetical protein